MNLIKKDKVGEGGSWKVFRCDVNYKQDKQFECPLIIKIAKGKSARFVNHNINHYEHIKKLGLPTLAILQLVIYEDKPALIGEYLNMNGWLFVSPNGVITEEQRMVKLLTDGRNIFDNEPVAEQKLYDRKLSKLINFSDFLDNALQDICTASKARLEIYFDSYFFGVKENETQSEIQYKFGDFDHIIHKPGIAEDELFAYNIGEFRNTMDSFIRHFIIADNQAGYLAITASKLSKLN